MDEEPANVLPAAVPNGEQTVLNLTVGGNTNFEFRTIPQPQPQPPQPQIPVASSTNHDVPNEQTPLLQEQQTARVLPAASVTAGTATERSPATSECANQTEYQHHESQNPSFSALLSMLLCLPCADKACFALWQLIAWGGLLVLTAFTVYGPVFCDDDDIRSAGIIVLVPFVMVSLISIACFIQHCCCKHKRRNSGAQAILICFSCLFVLFFFLSTAAGSFFVFGYKGNFEHIINTKDFYNETQDDYNKSIVLYIVLWVSCMSVQQSSRRQLRQ